MNDRRSPDNYTDLPDHVREFLEDLREEELDLLHDAVVFMNTVRLVGRFMKWMIITVIGAFLGAAGLGDAITKIMNWTAK